MRISLWYPLWEDLHCTRRRGTGADGLAGMLACRAACSQPPNNGPTLHEARGPGLHIQLNHGPWRMEGREGGSASGSTAA